MKEQCIEKGKAVKGGEDCQFGAKDKDRWMKEIWKSGSSERDRELTSRDDLRRLLTEGFLQHDGDQYLSCPNVTQLTHVPRHRNGPQQSTMGKKRGSQTSSLQALFGHVRV